MGRARRWARVALSGCVAASLCLIASGGALAAGAGVEGLGWVVGGSIDVGGMYSFGENQSAKYNEYRDMDNGFLGELSLRGEMKDAPYYFDFGMKNPTRDDQWYEGAFGRFGMFRLEMGYNETPHVLSNSAGTIYQQSDGIFTLPPSLRGNIAAIFTGPPAPTSAAGRAAISSTINGLLRPVDLGFNTGVGGVALQYTPLDSLRFDLAYLNIRKEGTRPMGGQMSGSTSGPVNELAIPINNSTNEVKFGAEYARVNWGLQFGYTGSFFDNQYTGYTWDNPNVATSTATANATDRIAAAPDNFANTFSLTGTAALPLRTRVNGNFSYTMLRQNQSFEYSTQNPNLVRTNRDDAGKTSADAQANLVSGNILVTSRPLNSLTATARYRYFEYQNDMPFHSFTNNVYDGGGTSAVSASSLNEAYTRQTAGIDLTWRPISALSLKGGYEYQHYYRVNYDDQNFSNRENIGRFSADVTPVDWFLGRLTYTYGDRTISNYTFDPTTMLPQSIKYMYAPRTRNRVDALLQFTPHETVSTSFSAAYAIDDYRDNLFGVTKDDYWNAGVNVDWSPLPWLTLSADYTYEQYNYDMASRYLPGGAFPGISANNWNSTSKDEFQNFGVHATVVLIPKKFDIDLGYTVALGYTTFNNSNPNFDNTNPNPALRTANPQAIAYGWNKVENVMQTVRVIAKYRVTEKLSLRSGFAYERYNEKDWARDPMQAFMGNYDSTTPNGPPVTQGVQSVWLGATRPNYEAYIFSGFVRYEF